MPWLASGLDLDSWPREIRLYSHSEYTIRFGHLIKVAQHFRQKNPDRSYAELVVSETGRSTDLCSNRGLVLP
jgi:hypothetical protein